jgi:hypothetical protein
MMTRRLRLFTVSGWLIILGLFIWTVSFAGQASPVRITVTNPSPDNVELTIDLPQPDHEFIPTAQGTQDHFRFTDEQNMGIPGQPDLPIISRLLQVGDYGNFDVNILNIQEEEIPAAAAGPMRFLDDSEPGVAINELPAVYPDWTAHVSEPGIMGGVRVASLSIAPMHYDSQRHVYRVVRHLQVQIVNSGGIGANPLNNHHPISEPIAEFCQNSLLNWQPGAPSHYGDLRGRYLIIVSDAYYQSPNLLFLDTLITWKQKKGYQVLLALKSQTGSTNNQIKAYIQNVYDSEGPPLSYVLLVGDVNVTNDIPTFIFHNPNPQFPNEYDVTDHPYALLEGTDYFPDVFVGRISITNSSDLWNVVTKVVRYEKTPGISSPNPNWYINATIVAGNYTDTGLLPLTPVWTSMWIQDKFLAHGFTRVDTFFWHNSGSSISPYVIRVSIDDGVSWVSYRGFADASGWQYPFFQISDVGQLNNGSMTPIVTSFVCRTGDFGNTTQNPVFGEKWLIIGTPSSPKGAVAFIGASDLHTNTRYNNPMAAGFYQGVFDENLQHLGQALLRGKMELYNSYPNEQGSGDNAEFYFHVYNLLGDPELDVRTTLPTTLSATHASSLSVGASYLDVTTRNSSGGIVPHAQVTLYKAGETHVTGVSGSDGTITLPVNLLTAGTMTVTVHTHNCVPYLGTVNITSPSTYIGLSHVSYSAGGDSIVSPGESVTTTITLRNTGSQTLNNVTATLSTEDTLITLGTTTSGFGNISAGATATNSTPLTFTVSGETVHNHQAQMTLTVSATGQGPWTHQFWVPVWGSYLWASRVVIQDGGNGILTPGETSPVEIWLHNDGVISATNLQILLYSFDNSIIISDSIGTYPTIAVGDSAANTSNRFTITARSGSTPGHLVNLVLAAQVNGHPSEVIHTSFTIGIVDSTYPLGPDGYGYYLYDSGDLNYSEHPTFNWVELDPDSGGSGAAGHLLADEGSVVLDLPFDFTYYGATYDTITVCSNGWISFGRTWRLDFENYYMPSALGPPALVAGFWDDLRGQPDDSLHPLPREVWTRYDASDHRYVIEWNRWRNIYGYSTMEWNFATFEIILRDPAYYQTVTGDGEIIMQYREADNVQTTLNYATVGIEDYNHTNGLTYTFANIYPPSCPRLRPNLAIKFTTDPPDTFVTVPESPAPLPDRITLLPGYPNPFNSQTVFPLELSHRIHVKISVFNVLGQQVTLLRDDLMEPGRYRITWDADALPSGIYFISMNAGTVHQVQKMVLLK